MSRNIQGRSRESRVERDPASSNHAEHQPPGNRVGLSAGDGNMASQDGGKSWLKVVTGSLLTGLLVLWMAGTAGTAGAHAGHDHGADLADAPVAEAPPRFYGHSDTVDVTLEFPDGPPGGRARIYLAERQTGKPISEAAINPDILTGRKRKLSAKAIPGKAGSYEMPDWGDAMETASLTLEISSKDMFDIVSVDSIRLEPKHKEEEKAEPATVAGKGIPPYLVNGLAGANLVLLLFLLGLARRNASRRYRGAGKLSLLMISGTVAFNPGTGYAHSGEDHSRDSTALGASVAPGEIYFVPAEVQFAADIRTTVVVERKIPTALSTLGQVEVRPDYKAFITPPSEGRLLLPPNGSGRIPVVGDHVEKGDVLAVLEQTLPIADRATLTSEKGQVETELAEARQQQALAERDLKRAEQLLNVIPGRELDEARTNFRIATNRVSGMEARLQSLEASLAGGKGNTRQIQITSPLSGTIAFSHASLGEYVDRDKTLFEIVNIDEVFVRADIFETDIPRVRKSRTARVAVDSLPNLEFTGDLHSVALEINPQTRRLAALFSVPNKDGLLRGGMFGLVRIEAAETSGSLVVPKGAVLSGDGVRHVFVKVSPEHFEVRPVKVREFGPDYAVVESGIKKGDRVAISSLYQLRMSPKFGRRP